jgi:hypothetical protein
MDKVITPDSLEVTGLSALMRVTTGISKVANRSN